MQLSQDYTDTALFARMFPVTRSTCNMRCFYDSIGKHDWPSPEKKWGYLARQVRPPAAGRPGRP